MRQSIQLVAVRCHRQKAEGSSGSQKYLKPKSTSKKKNGEVTLSQRVKYLNMKEQIIMVLCSTMRPQRQSQPSIRCKQVFRARVDGRTICGRCFNKIQFTTHGYEAIGSTQCTGTAKSGRCKIPVTIRTKGRTVSRTILVDATRNLSSSHDNLPKQRGRAFTISTRI